MIMWGICMLPSETKTCSCCGDAKDVSQFYVDRRTLDKLKCYCKSCCKDKKRAYLDKLPKKVRKSKWTYDALRDAAAPYTSRNAFRIGNVAAAAAATRSQWGFLHFCEHMTEGVITWTYERIVEEALKYKTKREFRKNDSAAFAAAERTGRMSEICSHMKRVVTKMPRYIYRISDDVRKIGYVGLAARPSARYAQHRSGGSDSVRELIAGNHVFEVLHGPVDEQEAQRLEAAEIANMRSSGYWALNKAKAGSLGDLGGIKWTEEAIAQEALKYSSIASFARGSSGAYHAARRRFGGVEKFCSHMEKLTYWDESSIRIEAKKYKTRTEFEKACGSAVNAARRLGIMDDVCSHMPVYRERGAANDNNKVEAAA